MPNAVRSALARMAAADPASRTGLTAALPRDWRNAAEGLLSGPDATEALRRASGLPEPILDQPLPGPAIALLHQGQYPARLLTLCPGAIDELRREARPLTADSLPDDLARAIGEHGPAEGVARVRTHQYVRIARAEVENAPLEVVGRALSDLAEACVQAVVPDELRSTLCVFGMGKLGGHELNFLSDIDLVFVHTDDLDTRVVARALRQMVQHLEGPPAWRPVFRVDLRLRPFGGRGPVAMGLRATEAYYEQHGRAWERQVWIRARPIAGNLDIGNELLSRLRPFVYRRSVTPAIFDEVSELMLRARREARPAGGDIDVKLDAGGIREIEFFVQAMQLLRGGRQPQLRTPSTLLGLNRLFAAGLVSDREHREAEEAYRFLRRVEHRVQLAGGQQTHHVPADPHARTLLATRLAAAADLSRTPDQVLSSFDTTLAEHRARVRAIAQTLHGPSDDVHVQAAQEQRDRARQAVLDPAAPRRIQCESLAHLGVADPEEVYALLQHLYSRPGGAFTAVSGARRGAENLLLACLDTADPDAAVQRLVEFASSRPDHFAIWRFCEDPGPGEHELMRLCAELFGSSEPLSRGLIGFPRVERRPEDQSVALLSHALERPALPDRAELEAGLPPAIDNDAQTARDLLQFKHRALVRIGLHDIGHRPDPLEIGRSLSALADLVLARLIQSIPSKAPFDLCVLALGKLGMEAMDYGSDLDLIFVYAPVDGSDGDGLRRPATATAQRFLALLGDRTYGERLYEVDMRLRPSGGKGLLVTSLERFRRYHAAGLPVWERLALLRARAVVERRFGATGPAGTVGDAITNEVLPRTLFGEPSTLVEVATDVRALKQRIEREVARETRDTYDVKAGLGGCLELELLVASLQLVHGRNCPAVRVRGITEGLAELARAGVMPRDSAEMLAEAYRFERLMLNRLRMGHLRGLADPERFSTHSPRLTALARRMGLADRHALVRAFHQHRRAVRDAFDLYLPASPE